jgi:hypothetical protein
VYVTINRAARGGALVVPTVNSFPLDASATSIPVQDLSLLSFYFAGASDVVHILWRDVITPDQEDTPVYL